MRSGSPAVSLGSRQGVDVRARQRFAPTAIQGLEVLSLPVVALTEYATSMVEQNPLLDFDYSQSFLEFQELPQEVETDRPDHETGEAISKSFDFTLPAHNIQRQVYDLNRLQDDCVETETLKTHLRLQMAHYGHDDKQREVINEIIEHIDDNGYFSGHINVLESQFEVDFQEVEKLLSDVQACSPRGVAARNLGECLLLQIDEHSKYYSELSMILDEDLEDFAHHNTALLTKKYGLSRNDLVEIRKLISGLDPRPGAAFYQQQKTTYVIPDVVVKQKATRYSVEVTGEVAETMTINKEYLSLIKKGTLKDEDLSWLTTRQDEANLVLRNISQRKQTLYRFALYLVEAQYDFFRYGEARLKPLTMQQVADALGVHVSTISRTVQDKHILTPWGTYPLKFFFCSALSSSQSEKKKATSSRAIKIRIKELVAAEDRQKPLSDASIMEMLNNEGIDIKRRTIAKYREALGIENQSRRRW